MIYNSSQYFRQENMFMVYTDKTIQQLQIKFISFGRVISENYIPTKT